MEQNKDQIGAVHALPSDLTEREQIELLCQVETYMSITEKHSQTAPEAVAEENRMYCMVNSFIAKRFSDIGAAVRGESVAECCDTPNYCSSARRCTAQDAAPVAGSEPTDMHPAWSRVILYTDSIRGKQTCRDDLWAITGDELRALLAARLSARAADAPSEPSGLTFDQWLDRKDENGWTEREAPCGEFRDMLRGWNAAMKFGKSRAADALDSQPTEPSIENSARELLRTALLASAVANYNVQMPASHWTHQARLILSQPTELPPLPDAHLQRGPGLTPHYTKKQMRAYGLLCSGMVGKQITAFEDRHLKARMLRNELAIIIGCDDGRSGEEKADAVLHWIETQGKHVFVPASSQPTDGGVRNG